MKVFLIFALIFLPAVSQAQTAQDSPDLVVVKFNVGVQSSGSGMIRSVQEPDASGNEPMRINQTARNEPQEVKNQRDRQERRADMTIGEMNATLSAQKNPKIYFYRLRVKNASTKGIKSFAWVYQSLSDPDPSDRQFFCHIKAKPNDNREIELFTPLAPSRIVDASKAGNKPGANLESKVIINKIEYLDGTFWKRQGWNPKTFPDDAVQKLEFGRCIGL